MTSKTPTPDVAPEERARIAAIELELERLFPEPRCELDYTTPFQLLVATVLSAQSTDVGVNRATPGLFAQFPDARAMALAEPADVVPHIRTLGLFNNKAAALCGLARQLVALHGGEVPAELSALVALPGVARKTANVVLQNAFKLNEGFVVDTHVTRLSGRLGLSSAALREAPRIAHIERDLEARFDRSVWDRRSHQLILLGRRLCAARKPACTECPLRPLCPTGQGQAGAAP